MKTRPITFPKTRDGEWTNAETGVRIVLHSDSGAYYVLTGGLPIVPTVGPYADYTYRSAALDVAKMYVENVVRPIVVAARDEAWAENDARDQAARTDRNVAEQLMHALLRVAGDQPAQIRAWLDRHHSGAPTYDGTDMLAYIEADHAEALAARCTGVGPAQHAFEYDPAQVEASAAGSDGYDEFERCERDAADPVHAAPTSDAMGPLGPMLTTGNGKTAPDAKWFMDAMHAAPIDVVPVTAPPEGWAEIADGLVAEMTKGNHTRVWVANQLIKRLGVTPSGAHAIIRSGGVANLAAPVQFPKGTPEYETYADELRGELAAWATGRDPYPYTREA